MQKTWRDGSRTCMDESIAEHSERHRRGESGYPKPMAGSGHGGSRRWRTKASSTRWGRFSTQYGKRTYWASATGSGRGADSQMRWTRCGWEWCARKCELDFRSRHLILFRQAPARLAGPVWGTSDGGSTSRPPDPEMAQGWRGGRRSVVRDGGRQSTRVGEDSPNAKDNFESERRLRFRRKSSAD